DHGGNDGFGIVFHEVLFEDAFAGAGLAGNKAKAALLGVHAQDLKDGATISWRN
ncbi:MAG: hypothetical protein ACI9TH_004932, partial [Kiritimatiellia bacterium]